MGKNYLSLTLLLVVILIAAALFYQETFERAAQNADRTGGSITALMALEVISGEMISEYDFAARPTLVVMWATWCPSCVFGLFHLKEAHEEFQERVNIVAVNITQNERSFSDVVSLLERGNFPFLIMADREGEAQGHFRSRYIPAYFLVNTNGVTVQHLEGQMSLEILDNWLSQL